MLSEYQRYKRNANGWGVPDFKSFRRDLVPLRKKSEWDLRESKFVSDLVAQGGGHALQEFFGRRHPVAGSIVGTGNLRETSSPDELAKTIRSMIRSCKKGGWTGGQFREYVEFLDSGLSIRDVRASATVSADAHPSVDNNGGFIDYYRSSGEWVKRHVREMFAAAAQDSPA